jgi:hypothetical protein
MVLSSKIANQIYKNPYIGLAKKKKNTTCSNTFQGNHLLFIVFLTYFLFFPKFFLTFQWIIMKIFFHNF